MALDGNQIGEATAVRVDPGDQIPSNEVPAAFSGKDPRLTPYGTTNLGTPPELLADLDGLVVPNDRFFVRSNGPTPIIAPEAWRLQVGGLVERDLTLSLADLQAMPRRTLTAFLECSGNSRSRFVPTAEGTPWQDDAVGNATWGGVSLASVLDLAGVRDGAVEIVSQGGDFAGMRRGLPLSAALDPDTLLAWEMNGEPLPLPHGGPVRLLVPGWGGIASIKWLVGLEVIDRPFDGPWNTDSYVFYDADGTALGPVREMDVKSIIVAPGTETRLAAGRQTIVGYAWSGWGRIARVEVSTDGGATYEEARIVRADGPRSWVRFEHPWTAAPGQARLRSRATDEAGNTQPETIPWNARGYGMHAVQEISVSVVEPDLEHEIS
ncbi:MAG: sulfite oxidase [Chloroflexota bacterium]|nr:sulfite oxidase [Chloroflexota bacterium]